MSCDLTCLGYIQVVDDEDGQEHFIKPTRIRIIHE